MVKRSPALTSYIKARARQLKPGNVSGWCIVYFTGWGIRHDPHTYPDMAAAIKEARSNKHNRAFIFKLR